MSNLKTQKRIAAEVLGIGESRVDSMISDLIREGTNPVIGLLSSPGEIKIRLTASADTREEAADLIQAVEAKIRDRLGDKIYGVDEETLETDPPADVEEAEAAASGEADDDPEPVEDDSPDALEDQPGDVGESLSSG